MIKSILSFLLIFFLVACKKNASEANLNEPVEPSLGLGGKWEAITHYYSNGSGLNQVNLTGADRFIVDFKSDSTLFHSANAPTYHVTYDRYGLTQSGSTLIINVASTATLLNRIWYYGFVDSTRTYLILSINPGYEPDYYHMKRI
ncbi:MAG: hypothetical protein NTW29_22210 [Bacteroidetes bacterium]|nr:hypothetical protein [Bacteroidota bacterium]